MKNFIRGLFLCLKNNKRSHLRKNNDVTIISNNCIGGVMYHSFKAQFLSPTINLWFQPSDFLKFVEKLDQYLQLDIIETQTDKKYPVGLLGDIHIYFQHYVTFEQARNKWNQRKQRMTKKIVVFMTETEEFDESYYVRFEHLKYERVLFVSKPHPEYPHTYHIPGTSKKQNPQRGVIDLLSFRNKITGKRYLDDFNYIDFLNEVSNSSK